jgi:CheY-like chemotaxis protein
VSVASVPGSGSTFYLSVPRVYGGPTGPAVGGAELARRLDPARPAVLVVEDDPTASLLYDKYLHAAGFQVAAVRTPAEARAFVRAATPAAVILDILLDTESGWDLLAELKGGEATRAVPVVVVTVVDGEGRAAAGGADAFCRKPVEREWLVRRLRDLTRRPPVDTVLVIDDDEIARYLLRGHLEGTRFAVAEATGGEEGLRRAREDRPRAVFLDLVMPDMSGFEVLDRLKADPATRDIPVIVFTSQVLGDDDLRRLGGAVAVLSKGAGGTRDEAARRVREALAAGGLSPAPEGGGR